MKLARPGAELYYETRGLRPPRLPVVEFPGDHLGYLTHSEELAAVLTATLVAALVGTGRESGST